MSRRTSADARVTTRAALLEQSDDYQQAWAQVRPDPPLPRPTLRTTAHVVAVLADQHVDAAVFGRPVAAGQKLENCIAGEYPMAVPNQRFEELKFMACQVHQVPFRGGQLVGVQIEAPAFEACNVRVRGLVTGVVTDPSQYAAYPREQFAFVKRLGDVIVGPYFQTNDFVDSVRLARQHYDSHAGLCPQLAGKAEAVFSR